ncbi:MAG TPA: FAD-dependent oxidoreductase [Vicinamibacteria bacterium]|nr:FAD-dependent oxidoreductase [Vicinamibacteria bacterium]
METSPAPLLILGGGPAGLGVAFYAARASRPFALYERTAQFGGICRTFQHGEHRYDCGAHRFHDRDPAITADVRALLGEALQRVEAPNQVWDHGRFLDFPPTPLGLLRSCGFLEAGRLGLELVRERWRARPSHSLEDFAVSRFGVTLSRRILLNYSEKLWGLPAAELSPDAATRRLQGLTLISLVSELAFAHRKAAHLDGSFLYPREGYGQICGRIEASLPKTSLQPNRDVVRLECRKGAVSRIVFADGDALVPQGRIVSTLPLPTLVKLLGDALPPEAHRAAAALRFRQLRLLFVRLRRPHVSGNASIYLPDHRFCVSRVCEPKNRSAAMAPAGETGLVAEVPCFPEDPISRLPEGDLAARVIAELAEVGLLEPSQVLDWRHHFVGNAYPVYARGYAEHVGVIRVALPRLANLDTIGRAGLFFYSHLHDQLRWARDYIDEAARPEGATGSSVAC